MAKFSKTGIESGASDLGGIVPVGGVYLQPFKTTPQDILTRHRAAQDGINTVTVTRQMDAGNRFEEVIRQWFEHDFDCVVEPPSGHRNKHCNLAASLDGLIDASLENPFMIVDFEGLEWVLKEKTVIDFKFPKDKPSEPEALPYHLQMQGQMDCAGANYAILAYLPRINLEWTIVVYPRHAAMIKSIRTAVNVFWTHMKDGTDYAPVTSKEANTLIPGNPKAPPLDLSEPDDAAPIDRNDRQELMELANSYLTAKNTIAAAEELEETAALRAKQILGGVEKVILPGNIHVHWVTAEYGAKPEKTITVPAKAARLQRRFTIKEKSNA